MGKYKNLQKYISEYFKDKSKEDLEEELFYSNPELFNEISKYRQYGIAKRYKKACKKYSVNKELFFFESNLARQYTGNPRYIYERMLERYPNYTYVWSYDGDEDLIPGNPIVVERKSDDYYRYLAQAGFLINNTVFPVWYPRKESFYLQTWHGTPYKKMHWDIENKPIKASTKPDFYAKSTSWNALLSPNHYSSEKFKSGFKYDGEILEFGYPANDIFYNSKKYTSKRLEIREKLNISEDSLVYLYAPTWRDGGYLGNSMFKFDLMFDTEEFIKKAPDNSVLLIRSHHMSDSNETLKNLHGRVIDVSGFDDAVELMCASDILITDYSSIVFDWYCSKKPVIYFVPDLDKYVNELRGSYFDIEDINCGIICKSEEELYDNLNLENTQFYEDFYNKFCNLHSGDSADKVIDYLIPKEKSLKNKLSRKILFK